MSKATYIPAKTETKTIELEPATVTLELTVEDAQILRAILAQTTTALLSDLYYSLNELHTEHSIPRKRLYNMDPINLGSLSNEA